MIQLNQDKYLNKKIFFYSIKYMKSIKKPSVKKPSVKKPSVKDTSKNIINKYKNILGYVKKNPVKTVGLSYLGYSAYKLLKNPLIQNQISKLKQTIVSKASFTKHILGELYQNRYTEIKKLGKGAFGSAIIALDTKTNENVVIKQMPITNDVEGITKTIYSYKNELDILQKLSKLRCKYTCCYVNHQFYNDSIYIIYTLKYTETLDKIFNSSEDIKSNTIKNLICGLKFLHKNNISHLDIKPENIVVNPNTGDINYIDFGGSCNGTCIQAAYGSAPFMSPEMLSQINLLQQQLTHPIAYPFNLSKVTDIWSLGVVIYMLLYNKHPYLKDYPNMSEKENLDIIGKKIIIDYNINVLEEYNILLKGMLDINPETRFDINKCANIINKSSINTNKGFFFRLF